MLINFHVENFGSVKTRQTLSFEADKSTELEDYYIIRGPKDQRLLKLALIYGANASGKTTIVRALNFLRNLMVFPHLQKTEPLNFQPFLFDNKVAKTNSILAIDFIENNIRYEYEVEFNQSAVIREQLLFYNPNKAVVFNRTTDVENELAVIEFGSKIEKDKAAIQALEANTLWNNTVLGGFVKTNVNVKELKDVSTWVRSKLRPLVETHTSLKSMVIDEIENGTIEKADVLRFLRQADFNIADFEVVEEKEMSEGARKIILALDLSKEIYDEIFSKKPKEIEFVHTVGNAKYSLPFELQSQGTQRYFAFAGLLAVLSKKSMIFPIDELESSLHPDLYRHFLLSFLANSKTSQVIATTHNREILNSKDIFRNDAIWFTEKGEDVATELYSLSDFDSSTVRDTTNILNAYKSGKLGGVPNLGDYFID